MNLMGCDKIEINKPREGLKKIVEFSSKRGGGWSSPDFPLRKKQTKKAWA